jgi:putative ABC transport system permease protein
VILNGRDFVRAWASERASAFQLVLRPRASAAVVGAEARRMLGDQSALTVETAAERQRRHYASTADALSRLSEIRTIVLIAAVLAIGAAMGGLLLQRRPRLARLRLDGLSTREVQAALAIEVSVLVGTAAGIGAAAGLLGQVLLDRALTTITGFPVDASVSIGAAAVAAALVTVSALGLVAVSGAVAARVAPAVGDG